MQAKFARAWWLLLWLATAAPAASAPLNVAVVLSNDSAPYTEMADVIAAGLRQSGVGQVRTLPLAALPQLENAPADIVVAIGLKAVNAVAAADVRAPVLSALIPRTS